VRHIRGSIDTIIVGMALLGLSLGAALAGLSPADRDMLERWTTYYGYRTNVSVAEVSFTADGSCASMARLDSTNYKLTYSTSAWCSWETERTRARRALCVIRMEKPDGSSRPRDVEECMRWYDN